MSLTVSRRSLLQGAAVAGLGLCASGLFGRAALAAADGQPISLRAAKRTIEVLGKPAAMYGLETANGWMGLDLTAGQDFHVRLANALDESTLIHWHGLRPPSAQDGALAALQAPIKPGDSFTYRFPLRTPGTHWMHSHLGLQEQKLLAAPLIVRDPAEAAMDEQEIVLLIQDFAFREPEDIMAGLRGGGHGAAPAGGMDHAAMGGHGGGHGVPGGGPMNHGSMGHQSHGAMGMAMGGMDLNDVAYDAFLANWRTLDDPEVVTVESGGRIRLRVINGSASTNFWLDLGAVEGELIAVDGHAVAPLKGRRFELATAQRLDIRFTVPKEGGVWPIFAQVEGSRARTGLILVLPNVRLRRIEGEADVAAPPVGLELETRLRAASPLAERSVDRTHLVDLTGSMDGYEWGFDHRGHDDPLTLIVGEGERVEMHMANHSMMAHPMHLHGHMFQVVAVNGQRFAGAMRDTVLVPPMTAVTVAFDADNPGAWAFHCHHLYHMEAGMMATLAYDEAG